MKSHDPSDLFLTPFFAPTFPILLASYSQKMEAAGFSSTLLLPNPEYTASHPWTQEPSLFTEDFSSGVPT